MPLRSEPRRRHLTLAAALGAFLLTVAISLDAPAHAAAQQPDKQEVDRALEKVKADPNLATSRKVGMLRWKNPAQPASSRRGAHDHDDGEPHDDHHADGAALAVSEPIGSASSTEPPEDCVLHFIGFVDAHDKRRYREHKHAHHNRYGHLQQAGQCAGGRVERVLTPRGQERRAPGQDGRRDHTHERRRDPSPVDPAQTLPEHHQAHERGERVRRGVAQGEPGTPQSKDR